ncbi:proteasome endopeptidase complex, archaeal, beta subunit [archaeon CG10_big_fil_rev_8_21_14_0_10_43_11]|nr:MAG: proteasome endopeptidase complex, archaeal, beta subunit [archaeon CG10_big_fil_rev_8_21_14_0_10_43_11]
MQEQQKDVLKTGTTTVGLVFKDGVILAADKRASMGYMIAHKNVQKIHEVFENALITIAGGVGDAQMLLRYIRAEAKLYELTNKRKLSISSLSNLVAHVLYGGRNQFMPYYVQFLLGGYDSHGVSLFVLGADGARLEDEFISTGSGSVFAYGVLQDHYSKDLDEQSATHLAVRAVHAAIQRDMASGDGIALAIITQKGTKFLSKKEIEKLLKQPA